jgi:hypothetical protein
VAKIRIPNDTLRAIREQQFRMSRPEFATRINEEGARLREYVTCTARVIATWEDGEVLCPRPVYCRILHSLTGKTPEELGFQRGAARASARARHQHARDGNPVERRTFLLEGAAGLGLSLVAGHSISPGRVGIAEVRSVERTTQQLYALDHNHGAAALSRAATESLHTVYTWLHQGSYTERTGRLLRSAAGSLSIAAGWLLYDCGRPGDARSLYGEALAAGRIADDPWLEAHAFACLAMLAKASGHPREAISAAQGAQSVARTLNSPRMSALFAMREAGGWALTGDGAACDRAIAKAHTLYAKGPRDEDPDWLEFFTPAELASLESLCRADLGQHDRAVSGAQQAVLLQGDGFTRNRALYTAYVAVRHTSGARPDPEQAVEAASHVLTFLPDVKSDRLVHMLHDVAGALLRHSRVPAVADWLEEYQATMEAV